MTDGGFDFAFAIWILNATGHGDNTVMLQEIAIQRIERGVIEVGKQHALAQVIQYDDARCSS
jgi:hypothetical protein